MNSSNNAQMGVLSPLKKLKQIVRVVSMSARNKAVK